MEDEKSKTENWTKTKIGDLCTTYSGGTPSRTITEYFGGNIPWIKSGELNSRVVTKTQEYITEKGLKNSSAKFVNPETVLVAMYGATAGVVAISKIKATINQAILAIVPQNGSFENLYLFYQLENSMQSILKNLQGAQPNLNADIIKNTVISCPPIAEQKRIAEILSAWDNAIEQIESLITAKQTLKRGLTQQLLTGKKRFPEFQGQAWTEVHLGDVFNEIKDINDGGDSHSIMTISARRGLISQKDKFDRVIAGDSLKKYTQLKQGDFAYNKGNSKLYEMGCIYQLENKQSALVPFVYICFSPTEAVCPTFYKHWFLDHGLDRQLKKIITSGARGDGLLNVNTDDFFKLKIPLPPIEEQKRIAEVFEVFDTEINFLKNKLKALKNQKRGLMQLLLTGKVRVKTNESEPNTASTASIAAS